ncbi:MAG: AAA family ATPase [Calditrichae bacterium]|nr:AAA family ATPase [Calditrichia bacterium]
MRIKEFRVHRYGPLGESGVVKLENFNLFYGNNEDGKTLTLEAMVNFLLGKRAKIFPGIDRVSHRPEGYLQLENQSGETFMLPEAGDISSIMNVTAEEYRNLFIIRNSDLTISRESEFYDAISERLTGLRTGSVQKVIDKLREIGDFTPTMEVVNTRESHYLKKRLLAARELVDECELLYHEAASDGYDIVEENLVEIQQRLRSAEERISGLGKARQRERYENGRRHLDLIYNLQQQLNVFPELNDEIYLQWQQMENVVREKEAELNASIRQSQSIENELAEEQRKLLEQRNTFEVVRQRKFAVDNRLRPLMQQMNEYRKDNAKFMASKPFFTTAIAVFLLVALISLAGVMWQPGNTGILVAAASSATGTFLMSLFYYFRFISPTGEHQLRVSDALLMAEEINLPGENLSQIQEQILRLEETYQRQQKQINEAESRVQFLEKTYANLRDERIEGLQARISEAQNSIKKIHQSSKMDTPAEYQRKLKERQRVEQKINESVTVLTSFFGPASGDLTEQLQQWESSVYDLRSYQSEAANIAFEEKTLAQATDERDDLLSEIQMLQQQLHEFRTRLGDIERRAYEVVLPEEDRFPSRTLSDLKQLDHMLKQFISDTEMRQHNVRTSINIFEEIEREEREKIRELFGEGSRISNIYSEITDALYPVVHYDADESGIRIQRSDGKKLLPSWLSSGAYDQLYFAVRIALGERLLQSEKGFFILDDPFLKSDSKRLRQQLDMLVEISKQGWQILYFSAKDEVVSTLNHHIDSGLVALQEAPQVDYKVDA